MIDAIFGKDKNTIEVCSGRIKEYDNDCFAVDINSATNPDVVGDGQTLAHISNNTFSRWRCDPPYNVHMVGLEGTRTTGLFLFSL